MPFLSRIAIPDSCRSNFLPFYHHPPHAFLLPRSLSRRWKRSPKLPCPLRVGVRFWASLTLRKLANASGRIVFNIALFMDWQFISGCLPPRLSTTQFPSTTDSQCSVRWGLPPHGWCALSGARRDALPRDPAPHVQRRCKYKNRRSYWCTKSEARIAALLRILAGCAARGGRIPAVVFD